MENPRPKYDPFTTANGARAKDLGTQLSMLGEMTIDELRMVLRSGDVPLKVKAAAETRIRHMRHAAKAQRRQSDIRVCCLV